MALKSRMAILWDSLFEIQPEFQTPFAPDPLLRPLIEPFSNTFLRFLDDAKHNLHENYEFEKKYKIKT